LPAGRIRLTPSSITVRWIIGMPKSLLSTSATSTGAAQGLRNTR